MPVRSEVSLNAFTFVVLFASMNALPLNGMILFVLVLVLAAAGSVPLVFFISFQFVGFSESVSLYPSDTLWSTVSFQFVGF